MKDRNNIDDLFRDAMTGYKVVPSIGMWRRIERRFFPPSKFRPSGLITSILLLSVAGLMPWVLIPANDNDNKEPAFASGEIRQGYLIEFASQEQLQKEGTAGIKLGGRTFTIRPTVYLANTDSPTIAPEDQFIASILDPREDPSIQPILSAFQKSYVLSKQKEPNAAIHLTDSWNYRMIPYPTIFMQIQNFDVKIRSVEKPIYSSSFSSKYEDDYFPKSGELSTGINFNPSIVFYNPNPYNKMIGAEAIINYKIASFSILSGIGYSRMEDIGSYNVDYISNDSVGYYLRVVSFMPDPRNPGNITYIVTKEPIYDSIPHTDIVDKTNYYSYIDIPLSIGYTFFQKSRVTLTARVGIKFSVLIDKQEPTVDFWISEAELVDIERQVPARMNTNWRFTAGVDFGYLFTNRFSLHLEPVFEQYISPLYIDQLGFSRHKPIVTGIKAGIRYNF